MPRNPSRPQSVFHTPRSAVLGQLAAGNRTPVDNFRRAGVQGHPCVGGGFTDAGLGALLTRVETTQATTRVSEMPWAVVNAGSVAVQFQEWPGNTAPSNPPLPEQLLALLVLEGDLRANQHTC